MIYVLFPLFNSFVANCFLYTSFTSICVLYFAYVYIPLYVYSFQLFVFLFCVPNSDRCLIIVNNLLVSFWEPPGSFLLVLFGSLCTHFFWFFLGVIVLISFGSFRESLDSFLLVPFGSLGAHSVRFLLGVT